MFQNKKKTTLSAVMKEIKLYITTHFIAKPTICEDNILIVCQTLLSKYANVKLLQGVDKGIPYFKIQVRGLFSYEELTLKILEKSHKSKQQYDLSWVYGKRQIALPARRRSSHIALSILPKMGAVKKTHKTTLCKPLHIVLIY